MRRFDDLSKLLDDAEHEGIDFMDENSKRHVNKWTGDCALYKKMFTRLDVSSMKNFFASDEVKRDVIDFGKCIVDHELFSNLNLLQGAVFGGDVKLLKHLVGWGVPLDYCYDEGVFSKPARKLLKKPPGTTPLLLSVISARAYLAAAGSKKAYFDAYHL
jgi:hypothetical protein